MTAPKGLHMPLQTCTRHPEVRFFFTCSYCTRDPYDAEEHNRTHAAVTVANFDSYGSLWGYSTIAEAEQLITDERTRGTDVDEWDTTDRDGKRLRIVRLADPTFLDTISVFTA